MSLYVYPMFFFFPPLTAWLSWMQRIEMLRRGQVSEEERSKQCKKEQQIRGTKDNIVGGWTAEECSERAVKKVAFKKVQHSGDRERKYVCMLSMESDFSWSVTS